MNKHNDIQKRNFERDKIAFEYIMNDPRGRHAMAMILELADPLKDAFNLNERAEAYELGRQSITRSIMEKLKLFDLDPNIVMMTQERNNLIRTITLLTQQQET